MTNRSADPRLASCGACPECGKQCYLTRKAARRKASIVHPGESFTVYRCGVYFHYGTPSPRVMRGAEPRRTT